MSQTSESKCAGMWVDWHTDPIPGRYWCDFGDDKRQANYYQYEGWEGGIIPDYWLDESTEGIESFLEMRDEAMAQALRRSIDNEDRLTAQLAAVKGQLKAERVRCLDEVLVGLNSEIDNEIPEVDNKVKAIIAEIRYMQMKAIEGEKT